MALSGSTRLQGLGGAGFVLVAVVLLGYAWALVDVGPRHLAFQTTRVEATVIDTEVVGDCARKGIDPDKVRVELEWVVDGLAQRGELVDCDPSVFPGYELDVWVTHDGEPASRHRPAYHHLLVWGVGLGIAAVVAVLTLSAGLRGGRRRG